MPAPRKLFVPNTLVMVTFRTEEGLPFVPLRFINQIIESALARAYELYAVQVCAFTFERNHAHLIIRVADPEAVSKFIGYLKQETAHCFNRLLGRRRRTIWAEGFDSPTILDSTKALKQMAYVLLNPVKDLLVSDIEEYPGVSSFRMMREGMLTVRSPRIFRDAVSRVKDPRRAWKEEFSYRFANDKKEYAEFTLYPYAWKECFEDTRRLSDQQARELLFKVLQEECDKIEKRQLNPMRLKRQSLLQEYQPKKFGKRMICLSISATRRKKFISFYRELCALASEAFRDWRIGKISPFPIGMFAPCLPRLANMFATSIWS